MPKLYWRVKRNGKWTWIRATESLVIKDVEITVEWPDFENDTHVEGGE